MVDKYFLVKNKCFLEETEGFIFEIIELSKTKVETNSLILENAEKAISLEVKIIEINQERFDNLLHENIGCFSQIDLAEQYILRFSEELSKKVEFSLSAYKRQLLELDLYTEEEFLSNFTQKGIELNHLIKVEDKVEGYYSIHVGSFVDSSKLEERVQIIVEPIYDSNVSETEIEELAFKKMNATPNLGVRSVYDSKQTTKKEMSFNYSVLLVTGEDNLAEKNLCHELKALVEAQMGLLEAKINDLDSLLKILKEPYFEVRLIK